VLEGLGLDLGQGVQIDFVASCFLREGRNEEEESIAYKGIAGCR